MKGGQNLQPIMKTNQEIYYHFKSFVSIMLIFTVHEIFLKIFKADLMIAIGVDFLANY